MTINSDNSSSSKNVLLCEVFKKFFENCTQLFVDITELDTGKTIFQSNNNSTNKKIIDKIEIYGNNFFQGIVKYLEYINYKPAEIKIMKNNNIRHFEFSESIDIGGNFFRLTKDILTIEDKEYLCLKLYNTSKFENHIDSLKIEAQRDSLTNLYNRNYFMQKFNSELKMHEKYEKNMALVIIDIDKFKNVNDSFGHDFGDKILMIFSKILLENLRNSDVLGRYGGEEFILLLPLTNEDTAYHVSERIRKDVETKLKNYNNKISITASFGVSSHSFRNGKITFDDIFKSADEALYVAKNNGRNCVEIK